MRRGRAVPPVEPSRRDELAARGLKPATIRQPDIQSFILQVAGNAAPAFTRPAAEVTLRRKAGACQAQAAVTLTAMNSSCSRASTAWRRG